MLKVVRYVCTYHLVSITYTYVLTLSAYLFSWQQVILECNQQLLIKLTLIYCLLDTVINHLIFAALHHSFTISLQVSLFSQGSRLLMIPTSLFNLFTLNHLFGLKLPYFNFYIIDELWSGKLCMQHSCGCLLYVGHSHFARLDKLGSKTIML